MEFSATGAQPFPDEHVLTL